MLPACRATSCLAEAQGRAFANHDVGCVVQDIIYSPYWANLVISYFLLAQENQ
jgi:hypothetical protein